MLVRRNLSQRKALRMKQLILLTTAGLLLGLLPRSSAVAEAANDQFRGSSWRLISGKFERNGKQVRLSAPRLQGFLVFDSKDHFLVAISRSGLSKIASKPGPTGAIKENKGALRRSVACFGTYLIDDANHTIKAHIEGSTVPKWTGTNQQRRFTITGDKLTWTNSASAGGAGTAELVWERVR